MPTCSSSARLWRDRRGVSATEFALFAPILVLLLGAMIDLGRVLYQTNAVEKGLRAGALFAARNDLPLSAEAMSTTENLVKTGNRTGAPPYLASGWAKPGASFTLTTRTELVEIESFDVLELAAEVPFDPLLPGVVDRFLLPGGKIRLSHEQVHLGD